MKQYKLGILGATGAVGREMMKILAERSFPVSELHLFASKRSAGKVLRGETDEKTSIYTLFETAQSENGLCCFLRRYNARAEKVSPVNPELGMNGVKQYYQQLWSVKIVLFRRFMLLPLKNSSRSARLCSVMSAPNSCSVGQDLVRRPQTMHRLRP